ncbi:steroid 17-alpha-hydroxylase/17,20 lyase-like [Lytechinus variegatus]|uniref:steroid 17-alpha-hydroxylase/17,20 lyase-like n=1 Tax=Lytechinus variegatus TaxID=7654 RepID=UPI001BB1D147|nr:steroid 17-alpha-hydroxylase/17,20 lyase-like [Lytechinus variegatus]XP_041485830.1 steroid 17-alpha-hydroxylase/17,20 lyase-like [Lytechinus variegatus]
MIDLLGDSSLPQVNGLTITATLGVAAISLALWTIVRPRNFPPGPRGFPLVGSLFSFNDSMEKIFPAWIKQYGDIFAFKLGEHWMVVLNHQEVIKEALLKQGVQFAGRPRFPSGALFSDGYKDIALGMYDDTWRMHRKLGHTALRHFATGEALHKLLSSAFPKLKVEVEKTLGQPVDPKSFISLLLNNIFSEMCFGKSFDMHDPKILEFMKISDDMNLEVGLGFPEDIYSFLKYVPSKKRGVVLGLMNRMRDIVVDQIADHKEQHIKGEVTDIYHLLLDAQEKAIEEDKNLEKLSDDRILWTIMDIFSAGIQTSTDTLYWALAMVTEHPEIAEKIRNEIDRVIGRDRVPMIEDRGTIPYTEATVYEVLRYSSLAPVLIPHATTSDTTLRGYSIPKGTTVMMNVFSMHFDPREWKDPENFCPEHFLSEDGSIREHPPSFMPFGAGRRGCLGEAVAKADLFLIFTWFMQNYTFSKVPGKESESLTNMIPKSAAGRVLLPYEIVMNKRE